MPRVKYRSKSIAASFCLSPSLYAINVALDAHGVNHILYGVVCKSPLPSQARFQRWGKPLMGTENGIDSAIASGLTILDATDANWILHIYSAVRNDFSRRAWRNIVVVAGEEPTSFTRNCSVRVWNLGVAGSDRRHLRLSRAWPPTE
jgi:hypothetical protein